MASVPGGREAVIASRVRAEQLMIPQGRIVIDDVVVDDVVVDDVVVDDVVDGTVDEEI